VDPLVDVKVEIVAISSAEGSIILGAMYNFLSVGDL
jgi:hypothetical protein